MKARGGARGSQLSPQENPTFSWVSQLHLSVATRLSNVLRMHLFAGLGLRLMGNKRNLEVGILCSENKCNESWQRRAGFSQARLRGHQSALQVSMYVRVCVHVSVCVHALTSRHFPILFFFFFYNLGTLLYLYVMM